METKEVLTKQHRVEEKENLQTERILVVDDEPAIRDLLQQGILRYGYECRTAESASDALEHLSANSYDVVISDINMPKMDGIQLTRHIKARYDSDVIVMTGYVKEYAYEEIVAMGASDFIQKPLRITEFIARLKRVLKERATLKERDVAMKDLQLNLEKFQRAMDGIVQAISLAIEMRDPYTAGHQQRVSDLACAIAQELGLSEDQIYGLRMASIIHDMGKITVPSEILCKPGRLSPIEYELIKNHVRAGYNILKKIEFPWPLADIILQHHERLDGSGYPIGLSGGEIMIESKILSVSDVFETIASHRPYRPSPGVKKALQELSENRNILYDSRVVDACITVIEDKKFRFETHITGNTFVTPQLQSSP